MAALNRQKYYRKTLSSFHTRDLQIVDNQRARYNEGEESIFVHQPSFNPAGHFSSRLQRLKTDRIGSTPSARPSSGSPRHRPEALDFINKLFKIQTPVVFKDHPHRIRHAHNSTTSSLHKESKLSSRPLLTYHDVGTITKATRSTQPLGQA